MIFDDSWAVERKAIRTALADLTDLDGRPAGRVYRARRHWLPTLGMLVAGASVVGLVAGVAAALAIAAYVWVWSP